MRFFDLPDWATITIYSSFKEKGIAPAAAPSDSIRQFVFGRVCIFGQYQAIVISADMPPPARLLADVEALAADGHSVTIVEEHPRYFVIIQGLALPSLYEPETTDLMVIADYQYPLSALDMYWACPAVRINGAFPQGADQFSDFIDRKWQRWSWHYTWNPSVHSLRSHLEVFFDRLDHAS